MADQGFRYTKGKASKVLEFGNRLVMEVTATGFTIYGPDGTTALVKGDSTGLTLPAIPDVTVPQAAITNLQSNMGTVTTGVTLENIPDTNLATAVAAIERNLYRIMLKVNEVNQTLRDAGIIEAS